MSVSGPNLLETLENNSESTIKDTQHHLRVKQALQDSRAQPNGNCMISLTENDIMVDVEEKVKEINLSDDSGIDSPSGDVNAEISRKVETDTLSDIISKNVEVSVKGFEETAVDATVGGTCKATGDVRLAPAEQYWCTTRDKAVKLRMSESGPGSESPLTIHQMFQWTVDNFGDHPALCFKKDGTWSTLTYKEYHQHCRAAAKSFLKLGLERFHGVGILGFNSPEWFIADIGCIMAGGLGVGIYTTNSPEACHYVANNCEANIIVVENDKQLEKILEVKDQLPHLKAIVQYKGEVKKKMPDIYTVGLKIN